MEAKFVRREKHTMKALETLEEHQEYNWKEVRLPCLLPVVPRPELERETGERRRGRDIIVAIDHGPNSKHAFDWALIHLCRLADTLHLVHVVSDIKNHSVHDMAEMLMEKLAVEAMQVALVKTVARIVEGDTGKIICQEAERLHPAAVVLGTRGRGLLQSVLQGSVGEYCFHNCKAPVIIVPGKVLSTVHHQNGCVLCPRLKIYATEGQLVQWNLRTSFSWEGDLGHKMVTHLEMLPKKRTPP